jgi:hypothetical protein
MQLEAEVGTEQIVAEVTGFACLLERGLEDLVAVEDLAVDIVVADLRAKHVAGDRHTLDQLVRVVAQDIAVLEGARLALVAVADDVLVALEGARHEAPLQACREARTAATAQRAGLELGNDVVARYLLGDDAAQRLVAAMGDIGRERTRIVEFLRPAADLG